MTKEEKREIRDVLLGRTVLADDGRITSLEPGLHLSAGIGDGAGAVRFFGIASRSCCFDASCGQEEAIELARKAMFEIGRGLILRTQPEAAACLIRYVFGRPVVLAFRYIDAVPVLTVWSGRSLLGSLSIKRAVKVFLSELPEGLTLSSQAAPENAGSFKKEKKKKKDKDKDQKEGEEQ